MRDLKREHRISVSMLSETFDRSGHVLAKVGSGENSSDGLTKPFGPEVHSRHAGAATLDLTFSTDMLTPEGAMTARAFWTNVSRSEAEVPVDMVGTWEQMLEVVAGMIVSITDDLAASLAELFP